MFTGIIQGVGKVVALTGNKRKGGRLTVSCNIPLRGIKLGDSVAIDGCCLTVVAHQGKRLSFDLADETFRKTGFSSCRVGTIVNLERAMKVSDRFAGHFVLGHVDGVGKIQKIKRNPGSVEIEVSYPRRMAHLLIDKGSVAMDGISLTIVLKGRNRFVVYIIPHTEKLTNLPYKKVGDLVNLEFDVLGKYVERLISLGLRIKE